ncbi:hypothetical protein GOBAR_AA12656 [Gossypium barbadense]|uniref:SHSP domain-containing protein n=1 Tax=Gossypium barbadense TaxID=3634 RepID=A0A2P5XXA0_GOSBA|nr:hypothetical protein GOBAR_AA12656 [Gossypium barbadense]
MAYSTALRRVPVSTLFSKLANLSPARTVSVATPTVARSFNTNAQLTNFNDEDRSVNVQRQSDRSVSRRRDSPRFFSGWDMREDNNALYIRIEMPGLSKEDVKISVEQNTLIIRGEGGKDWEGEEEEEEGGGRRYSSRLDLPPTMYKVDEIKAEMKNGVLKVVVPKVKEDERKDVYQVTVE